MPTTRADAKAAVEQAQRDRDEVRKTVIAKLGATAPYRQAIAALDAANEKLKEARASGTPQDRVDASSACSRARQQIAELERKATADDPACVRAEAALHAAKEALKKTPPAAEGPAPIPTAFNSVEEIIAAIPAELKKPIEHGDTNLRQTEAINARQAWLLQNVEGKTIHIAGTLFAAYAYGNNPEFSVLVNGKPWSARCESKDAGSRAVALRIKKGDRISATGTIKSARISDGKEGCQLTVTIVEAVLK